MWLAGIKNGEFKTDDMVELKGGPAVSPNATTYMRLAGICDLRSEPSLQQRKNDSLGSVLDASSELLSSPVLAQACGAIRISDSLH
jgi:hypothetical protein